MHVVQENSAPTVKSAGRAVGKQQIGRKVGWLDSMADRDFTQRPTQNCSERVLVRQWRWEKEQLLIALIVHTHQQLPQSP